MTPLTPAERAAIDAALAAGKVQRVESCPFWGGVKFERLPNGGEEMEGESERLRMRIKRRDFGISAIRHLQRQVARGEIV
jgi:hypothetical protein